MTAAVRKTTASVEGTEALGAAFATALRPGDVVTLSGPLGAGKTRFASGLVRALCPGARVRSPSFTLVNEFAGSCPVFHLDLYRLEGVRDVEGLGLEDYASRGALLVEWGERLPAAWRADALAIVLEPLAGDARAFTATATGPRGAELLAAWCALAEAW